MSDQEQQTGCAAMGSIGGGALIVIFAIAILTTVGTGGLALAIWIPIAFVGLGYMAKGAGTVADKTGVTQAAKKVTTVVSRETEVITTKAGSTIQQAEIKSRARKVIGQLQEQRDAGAIDESEFAFRVQSVLTKLDVDASAIDAELAARLGRAEPSTAPSWPTPPV